MSAPPFINIFADKTNTYIGSKEIQSILWKGEAIGKFAELLKGKPEFSGNATYCPIRWIDQNTIGFGDQKLCLPQKYLTPFSDMMQKDKLFSQEYFLLGDFLHYVVKAEWTMLDPVSIRLIGLILTTRESQEVCYTTFDKDYKIDGVAWNRTKISRFKPHECVVRDGLVHHFLGNVKPEGEEDAESEIVVGVRLSETIDQHLALDD